MHTDEVSLEGDGRILAAFDTTPIEMLPGLDDLLRRNLARPGTPSIASIDHG